MAPTDHDALYCRPHMESFRRGQSTALAKYLTSVDRHTTICPISDPDELTYDTEGCTNRGGYRFTAISFRQVAQIIAPGLSTLLPDLSGTIARKQVDEEMIDEHQARDIFNKLVRLRFPLLSSYRLLRNENTKTIDGVVGQKHRSLENLTMLEAAGSAVATLTDDIEFYAAAVVGRKMMLWYRAKSPMFVREVSGKPWSFYHGYYFRNAESTGTSVRGGLTVYTRHGSCLAPFTKKSRVTHIGRDFNQRLGKMFQHILGPDAPVEKFQEGVDNLLSTSLGYAELGDKEKKRFEKDAVKALSNIGLPQRWASEIFETTLKVGSVDLADLKPLVDFNHIYATRTFFDMFSPLVRMARDLPSNRREGVEQVAYKVLTGKLEM